MIKCSVAHEVDACFLHLFAPEWINAAASGGTGGTRRHRRHLGEAGSFGLRHHTGTFLPAEVRAERHTTNIMG